MASSHARDSIVIVGAGIIGLDVALVLSERGYGKNITVIAEHLPGDTAESYTSPWAGCNFSAISGSDANALRWDKLGYAHLSKLASERPEETFVRRTESIELWDEDGPQHKIKAMSEYLEDFRVLPEEELPKGVKIAIAFTTLTINAPRHLLFLHQKLKDHYGVQFVRQRLSSIQAAFSSPATKIVFNCIGNAARTLPGIEDAKCFPTRGQVLLTRAPHVQTNILRHGKDYETYIIPRPESNGNVILGGFMQKGVNDGSTYAYETDSILDRTMKVSPELSQGDFEVLAAVAGMRPSREGGARVERGEVIVAGEKRVIVHNYGAGGTGYQAGYGMAIDAVKSVEDVLRKLRGAAPRPRL